MSEKNLSMMDAYQRQLELRVLAERSWEDFAQQMLDRVPACMNMWAEANLFDHNDAYCWRLPEMLMGFISRTILAQELPGIDDTPIAGWLCKHKTDEIREYGFRDLEHLEHCYRELANAWRDVVRIRLDKNELPYHIGAYFYAIECMNDAQIKAIEDAL